MKIIVFCIVTLYILETINASPVTPYLRELRAVTITNNSQAENHNDTIEEIVKMQTDTIKQIVSSQQQEIQQEYPVLPKSEPPEKQTPTNHKMDDLPLEELKTKCQQLMKQNDRIASAAQTSYGQHIRPIYLQERYKVTTKSPLVHNTIRNYNGFYITQPTTSTTTSTTTTKKPLTESDTLPQNIKFIKLEPVILQKTILNDGRIIYYWHKSLPSAVKYAQTQAEYDLGKSTTDNQQLYRNSNFYPNIHQNTYSSTTTSTTTTTPSSGLGFKSYFPFYWASGSSEESTTESTTQSIVSTTPKPFSDTDDTLYEQQMRFVVPVPYEDPDNATKYIWDFDQFAYYPKPLQPSSVKVQVPYVPTFHMIKALTIPSKYVTTNAEAPNDSYPKNSDY